MPAPTNLPVELTSFVGRGSDIERVSTLLQSSRLINLAGPGGVGKTRLAIQSALKAGAAFPDGVWFIDLTATTEGEVVPSLVAAPLAVGDVDTSSARELTDVLADYMADKKLLLILDNCEHVMEAVRDLVPSILTRCLDVRILATGRENLGLQGEVVMRVAPLPVESMAPGERPDAVRLFLDRASQVRADYRPNAEALDAIEDIVRRLDGLPLAIELAASRTKLLSPEQILDRLADRFRFLEGDQSRPDRHETLQATIEWSYELLDTSEQEALQRLAPFTSWSLEAAEAALGETDSTALLGGLVDKSLVDVVQQSPANRYRMLGLVRQFALEQLAEGGGEDAAHATHAEYFLALAEKSDIELRGPNQAIWVEKIKQDHDNIRAALGYALTEGHTEMALRLVAAMGRFWFMQTHWNEALRWLARASEQASADHEVLWARAFLNTGVIELITRGVVSEPDAAQRAHRILSEYGDTRELALATWALAEARQGTSGASELMAEARRLFDETDDPWGRAYTQRWLGSIVELYGDAMEAVVHQRQGVAGFAELGDRWSAGWVAFDLGFSLLAGGLFEEANKAFEDATDLVSEIDDRLVTAHASRGKAAVAAGLGRLDEARQLFYESIPLFEQIGDQNCLAFSHLYLADVETQLDHTEGVTDLLAAAITGFISIDNLPGVGAALRRLAHRATVTNRADLAAKLLGASELPELSRDQLSAPEQLLHDEVEAVLGGELTADELESLRREGAQTSVEELFSAAMLHLTGTDTAPVGDPDVERPTTWPPEYDGLRRHLGEAWKVEREVLVHRGLGGKSGATVLAVDLMCSGFSGQAILKLERVDDPSAGMSEADRHRLAYEGRPEFAAQHLPRIVHSTGVDGATALLSTIAGRGLEYTLPWADSPYAAQLEVGRRLARRILEQWNSDYRLADSILTPQDVLAGWLDYRLKPPRGRIHGFVEKADVDPMTATVMWDGHWYPNPLAFAVGVVPTPESLGLRPAVGHTHGDLHGYNVLVRTRDEEIDWFLIDLAFYQPDQFLFFDHAYFELSHLLETRSAGPIDQWMPLLAALAGREEPSSDDVGVVGLLRQMRAEPSMWMEETEPDRLSYMESQMILARVAVGLNFTHKRVPSPLQQRGFLYAMSALKEYVRFHAVDWPRTGESLVLQP